MTVPVLSICTGVGGLDEGVISALREKGVDAEVRWFSEIDQYLSDWYQSEHLLARPLGDIRKVDWSEIATHSGIVLTAGYPCQPFSQAGRRLGDQDPRHLWPEVLRAIRSVRPSIVVLENVQGHLKLGFERVLADLAEVGFDAEWSIVRASDIGAPHQRARLYVVAWPSQAVPHSDNTGRC